MTIDLKRELFRHLIAGVAFRVKVAVLDAPSDFAGFRLNETIRTPGEILAHMGDLFQGSLSLMKGQLVYLKSAPLAWQKEIERFFEAVQEFDTYLASDGQLHQPIEKVMQGPMSDALTHVGQIVLLRRAAGAPVQAAGYFEAEIIPGQMDVPF